jgi:hypothetical protein
MQMLFPPVVLGSPGKLQFTPSVILVLDTRIQS